MVCGSTSQSNKSQMKLWTPELEGASRLSDTSMFQDREAPQLHPLHLFIWLVPTLSFMVKLLP